MHESEYCNRIDVESVLGDKSGNSSRGSQEYPRVFVRRYISVFYCNDLNKQYTFGKSVKMEICGLCTSTFCAKTLIVVTVRYSYRELIRFRF